MAIIEKILAAAKSERDIYVLALNHAVLSAERVESLPVGVSQDFSEGKYASLSHDPQILARRLSYIDQFFAVMQTDGASHCEQALSGEKQHHLIQNNGRINWENVHSCLIKNREPVTEADFDKLKEHIQLRGGVDAIKSWNEHVWFTPQFLAQTLQGLPHQRFKSQVHFEQSKKMSLTIDLLDESGETFFESHVKFNFEQAVVEEKKYFLLNESQRGKGIVKPLLQKLHSIYGQLGIRTLRTSAELENGAYVWARAGYLPTPSAWNKLAKKLAFKLEALQASLPKGSKIEEPYFSSLNAAISSSDSRGIWVVSDTDLIVNNQKLGYYLLAGEQWKGYLNIDDKAQMERCRLFVEGPSQQPSSTRPRLQAFGTTAGTSSATSDGPT